MCLLGVHLHFHYKDYS